MPEEIWEIRRDPGRSWAAQLRQHAIRRARRALERASSTQERGHGDPFPEDGPSFTLAGFDAPFSELEAILWHPEVCRAIEGAPDVPLDASAPPPARIPAVAERLAARPRPQPARLYDIVPFGLELDVLELRLLELFDLVDVFVIVEAARGYGGVRKPLFFARNASRFARFAPKLVHLVVDEADHPPSGTATRGPTDFAGEYAFRAAMWRAVRSAVSFEPNAVVIAADVDELPPRNLLYWVRHHVVPLPLRVRMRTLRYSFGWEDRETNAELVMLPPDAFPLVDEAPERLRVLPGITVGATGAVHLTSFVPPLALVAKFAMTTDWDPGIVPFVRNAHGETAAMMRAGRWFSRRLAAYDPNADADRLVPWAAKANRARFARLWPRSPQPARGWTSRTARW